MQQQSFNFAEKNSADVQKIACDINSSVFLFANAGTGKTKTLCDRFMGHVLFGSDASKILCLTYTNAAAEEMKERILGLAFMWSKLSDDVLENEISSRYEVSVDKNLLTRAKSIYDHIARSFPELKIQTLHAFCSALLTRFSEYNPNNKNYEVADSIEMAKMRSKAINKALLAMDSHEILEISRFYTLGEIRDKVQILLSKSAGLKRFFKDKEPKDIRKTYNEIFQKKNDKNLSELEKEVLDIDSGYLEYLNKNHPKLFQLVSRKGITIGQIIDVYFTKTGEIRKNIINLEDDFVNQEIFRIEKVLNCIKKEVSFKVNIFFLKLTKYALDEIEAQKDEKQVLEFDDLLLKTHELLSVSENAQNVLHKLDYNIDQILVDEAQDLSSHQWEIINLLSEEFFSGVGARDVIRNIFVVGDFKQSIYSFQGAEPSVFIEMCNFYNKKCNDIGRRFLKLEMIKSYRTTKTVLKLVDDVFSSNSIFNSKHISAREGEGLACIYPLIEKNEKKQDAWILPQKDEEKLAPDAKLARKIANEIKNWVAQKRLIRGKNRPVEPKDIYVLFRKRSELMTFVSKELKTLGINVNSQFKITLNESLLWLDFKSILQFVIDPHDDFNLSGLLKSPFFNLQDYELSMIQECQGNALLDKVKNFNKQLSERLNIYIVKYQNFGIRDFFEFCIRQNYEDFLRRFGQSVEVLIEALIIKIESLAQDGVSYTNLLEEFDNFDMQIDPQNESSNAVCLMTIHSSKGLQAPIVILADSSASANSPNEEVIWYEKTPLIIPPKKYSDYFFEGLKDFNKRKQNEERDRLLYVALTRAEDELHAFGIENKSQDKSWYSNLELFASKHEFTEENLELNSGQPEVYKIFATNLKYEKPNYKFVSNIKYESEETLKGELCHLLLEMKSYRVSENSLKNTAFSYSDTLSKEEVESCIRKVLLVSEKFPWMFGENTESEVAFQNELGEEIRVDRLVFENDSIHIIDFKSDEKVPRNISQVRPDYIKQLSGYSKLLERFYSKKTKTSIVWIEDGSIIEL